MKILLSAIIVSIYVVSINAQYLVTGNNLFATANYIAKGDDSSSYVVGEFFTYEVENFPGQNIASYGFKISDSIATCDTCAFEHSTSKLFVSKISKNGDVEWILISKTCDTLSIVQVIEVISDDNNNLLITGIFQGNVELNGVILSTTSTWDMFIYKISPEGNLLWGKSGFAQGTASKVISEDITAKGTSAYISGSYSGNADFSGDSFQSVHKQLFLLQLDENGNEVEVHAGVPLRAASTSDFTSVDFDQTGDIIGFLSVEDSVGIARKQSGFPRDTICSVIGFEEEVLYLIDSVYRDSVTAVVDSIYFSEIPHWKYLVEYSAITNPSIILDSLYRPDTDLPIQLHHISVFRGDTIALSSPVQEVPLDFQVDRIDNGLYGLYNFSGEIDFGSDIIPAPLHPSVLLVKYRFDGGIDWYKTGECGTEKVQASSFSIDRISNIYVAGSVGNQSGTHVLNFDGHLLKSSKDEDAFIIKLEAGSFSWGQILGDSATDLISDIYALDRFNIVVAGAYSKQLEYDRFSIQTSGVRDLFVGTIDPYPSFDLAIVSYQNDSIPLCEGDSVLLVGQTSHGSTLQWMRDSIPIPGETGDSLWVTTSGSYCLKAASLTIIRDDLSPYTKISVSVDLDYTPYPNDSIIIKDTTVFCYGNEATLRIETGAGDSCSWYSLSGGLFVGGNNISVSETDSYYARVDGNAGCVSFSDTIEITAIPLPDDSLIITGGNYMFCSGDSLQIKSLDPDSNQYIWYMNADTLKIGSSPVIWADSGAAYSVEIINDRNCGVRSDTIVLVEITPPVLLQQFDDVAGGICDGAVSEIRLSNHSHSNYNWFFNNDTVFNNNSPVLYITDEGYYHAVVVKEGVCTVYSDTFFLAVYDVPVAGISVSPDSVICDNESVVLTASGGSNYLWYYNGEIMTDSVTSTIRVSEDGVYKAEISNIYACSAFTRSVPVVVKRAPNLSLRTDNESTAFCRNDSLRMFVDNSSGILYQWKRDGQLLPTNNLSNYAFEPGEYLVILEDTLNGCVSQTNSINLTVLNLPDPLLTYSDPNPLCDRDTILLISGASAEVYKWFRNGQQLVLETNNSLNVTIDGSYHLIVKDSHNCSSVSGLLTFDFLSNLIPPIKQDLNYLFTTDFDHLQWVRDDIAISGSTGQVYLVNASGYYHVEVTHENGCVAASDDIRVCSPFPIISANGNMLRASEGESYQWFFGKDTIFGATDPVYMAQLTGNYSVDIAHSDGCVSRSPVTKVCYPVPAIELDPNNVLKSTLGLSYQWYKNDEPIEGADARLYVVTSSGQYKVEVESLEQCISFSDPVSMNLIGIKEWQSQLKIYPNPAKNGVNIVLPAQFESSKKVVKLYNIMGDVVYEKLADTTPIYLELEKLNPGFYLLTVEVNSIKLRGVVVKE